jgi:hypothetical protein
MSDKFNEVLWGDTGRFFIGKADYAPPLFLEDKRTGEVFATLSRPLVGFAVDLDKNLVEVKGEVRYSPETKEWVLGPIRFSEESYFALKHGLTRGWIAVKPRPVSEEHITPSPDWGPEVP